MATETLRPNAVGDETSICCQIPGGGEHWDKVDEADSDEHTTRIRNYQQGDLYKRDLYKLPASSGSGTINFIKIYIRAHHSYDTYPGYAKPSLKSNGEITDGTEVALTEGWVTYSEQWSTNPADSQPWEWSDIDALQIGVSLNAGGVHVNNDVFCTQVYVEVGYSPPPGVTPNLTDISLCDELGTWAGDTVAIDTDFKIQGAGCCATQVKAATSPLFTFTLDAPADMTGKHIYIWMMVAGVIDIKANGGLRIYAETDANNYGLWYVAGNETYSGGWACFIIDPASTPTSGAGTVNPASIAKIGVQFKTLSSVVGQAKNCFWDACRYGTGLTVTSGVADAIDLEDIFTVDDNPTNKYGVVQKGKGTYIVQGLLTFGGTGAENVDFIDKSQIVIFPDNEFVSSSFYGIKVQRGTGTTNFILGEQADTSGISGCLLKAAGIKTFSFDVSDADNDKVLLYGTTFINAGIITLPPNATNREVVNCNFEKCAEVLVNTCIVQYCSFISADDRAAKMSSTSHHTTDCTFIGCPKAIHIDVADTYEFNALKFIGNTYDIENSTDGGDVYIDRTNGSDPSSEKLLNSGSPPGTITINPLSVYLTVTVVDKDNLPVELAQTAIYKTSDDTELMNKDTGVDGVAQETFQYVEDTNIYIRVRKSSLGATRYFPIRTTGKITSTGYTLTAVMIEDKIAVA